MTGFSDLPDDALIQIFAKLDYKELSKLHQVDWRCSQLAASESLWKNLCITHWHLEKKTQDTWKLTFASYFENYGSYMRLYHTIGTAWNRLKDILRSRAPTIASSLQDGITETELDDIESQYKCKLPRDLRLFYRLCGGQSRANPCPGLFGSLASVFTHSLNTYYFVHPNMPRHTHHDEDGSEGENSDYETLPVASDYFGNNFSAVLPTGNNRLGADGNSMAFSIVWSTGQRLFKAAPCFTDWFLDYVKNVVSGSYVIDHGHILRYLHEPDCVARTGAIEVRAGWVISQKIEEKCMLFEYRITVQMDEDANPRESCQLMERHWVITHSDSGKVDRVNGAGVVGEYPTMKPGAKFSWMSRTYFGPPGGAMEGHFTMRSLTNSSLIEIECPRFTMPFPQEAKW